MIQYQIREMISSDWERIMEIYKQGIDTNLSTFQREIPSYQEWDSSHLKMCRLVILSEDQIAGFAVLSPVSSRCVYAGVCEISIYIDSNYQHKGLGTVLLNELIKKSEQLNIWTLQSGIMEDNEASIKLHKKCGFRMVGFREKIGCDYFGNWRNTVLMEKRSPLVGLEKEC